MFEFISRFGFGKNHEEVKNRSVSEVITQLAGLTEESLNYLEEHYELDVDELKEKKPDRTRNKDTSIVYITLRKIDD